MLGARYQILELLGQGGMGAVYKARDLELDRVVALKVIRPDLALNSAILRRFKQELILARQVTHRNVIRIFDLGEADNVKFITMEYIEGKDLRALLREVKKLAPAEAAGIIEQVCRALEAAHSEGVIHRDLKPQNIMLDKDGKVSVMDFGIARSIDADRGGMTLTHGALVGTPEYMSPEQAKGEKLDARTDLFSLGIIFYELLTGDSPYKADTAMASLYKRTAQPVRPPIELVSDLPRALSDIVVHCLQIEKEKRYASASEILNDLAAWRTSPSSGATPATRFLNWLQRVPARQKWAAAAVLVAALVVGAFVYAPKNGLQPVAKIVAPAEPTSLAILPFQNATGDPKLDWIGSSLSDMLSTDIGQSPSLRIVSPDRVHQLIRDDLHVASSSGFDANTVRWLSDMANADTVISGKYAKFGNSIRIDLDLHDLKHNRNPAFKVEVASENELLGAIDGLAQTVRQNLTLAPQVLDQLKAQSFKPSSNSLSAIRLYSEGTDLARQGKHLEAVQKFRASTEQDPEFALAYAKLGQSFANIGHDNEAEQFARKAVDFSEHLPPREKYLIAANYARIKRDYPNAIQSYENLVSASPDDLEAHFTLGRLYEETGEFDKSRAHYSKVLSEDPKNLDALLGMGRVDIRSGNPQAGIDNLSRALTLSVQLENDEAKASILQAVGVAYRRLGKQDEALHNYQQSLDIKRRLGDKRGIAASLNEIAQIQEQLGHAQEALNGYNEALKLRREIQDSKGVGDTLIDLGMFNQDRGHYDDALKFFKESLQIQRDLGSESNQGLCLNNIGTNYFSKGDYQDALTYFQQALELREKSKVPEDTLLTVHNLAETNAKMGQYGSALTFYVRALDLYRQTGDKRGAAIESYSIGTLFGYQGRFGAALKSKDEALKSFQELQDRTFWMAEISSGYGKALADVGRFDEAQKALDSALASARELKNDGAIAQALNYQGECLFYRGDFKSARGLFDNALQFAQHSKERDKIWLSKFNLARATLKQGKAQQAAGEFKKLAGEADTLGLKYFSAEASAYSGEALLEAKDYRRARQELESGIARAERLDLRAVLARDHYYLASTFKLTGDAQESAAHYRAAARYVDEIRDDTGSDALFQRSDLGPIHSEAARYTKDAKSN